MAAYRGYEKRSSKTYNCGLNYMREASRRECVVEVISKKGINCTVAVVDISSIPHHSN
ncbi:hypothetical protein ALC60_13650 [Trachymyrmex zeteki]|uniref:Uncharacterized protein n=1 Tax=Mycetomoellerius zeteki TaxID=64791 RepID=A0A151WHM6_9HYME|nr:hypothetical protein ALC60_13650 [Trachymyrmex zeteki]